MKNAFGQYTHTSILVNNRDDKRCWQWIYWFVHSSLCIFEHWPPQNSNKYIYTLFQWCIFDATCDDGIFSAIHPSIYNIRFFKVPEKCSCCDCTSHKISVIEWYWMLSAITLQMFVKPKQCGKKHTQTHVNEYRHPELHANKEARQAHSKHKFIARLQSFSITLDVFC